MTWQDEQEQFWRWINRPQDLNADAEQIATLLAPHSHLSSAEALSIYNNAYHQRLVEVSRALFPVLFNTLGRDIHTQLWIGYMGEYPPRNGPINRIGEFLGEYVGTHEQFKALPAVADIVRLESLLISLFDVADEQTLTRADLERLPAADWGEMRWQGKQDWALMRSRFDLERYWRQMQDFIAANGEPGTAEFGLEVTETPTVRTDLPNYLVYRRRHRMQFQIIRPELALFLEAIRERATFADICVRLADNFPDQDIPQLSLALLLRSIELELLAPGS